MGVIFDTSVLIPLERGLNGLDALIEGRESEPFGISVVTVSELLHGVHRADSEKKASHEKCVRRKDYTNLSSVSF